MLYVIEGISDRLGQMIYFQRILCIWQSESIRITPLCSRPELDFILVKFEMVSDSNHLSSFISYDDACILIISARDHGSEKRWQGRRNRGDISNLSKSVQNRLLWRCTNAAWYDLNRSHNQKCGWRPNGTGYTWLRYLKTRYSNNMGWERSMETQFNFKHSALRYV